MIIMLPMLMNTGHTDIITRQDFRMAFGIIIEDIINLPKEQMEEKDGDAYSLE